MVKLHCDRCGKEIVDCYYTVCFEKYEANPKHFDYNTACSATSYSSSQNDVLRMLKSQEMYCEQCKAHIALFMKGFNNETKEYQ